MDLKWSDAIFHPTAQADVFPAIFPSKFRSQNQQGPVLLAGLTPVFLSASSLSLNWVEHGGNPNFPCPQSAALIQHPRLGQSFPSPAWESSQAQLTLQRPGSIFTVDQVKIKSSSRNLTFPKTKASLFCGSCS